MESTEATGGDVDASTGLSSEAANLDRQTEARLEEIAAQIKEEQPLTSERSPLSKLEAEYASPEASNFLAGVKSILNDYEGIRFVRGDGNCYYRAFLYSLAEDILSDPATRGATIRKTIKDDSWNAVLAAGYDEMMLEVFYDTVVDLLERLCNGKLDASSLHTEMNQENSTSDYCTWYLRVVTAVHLKQDPDRFIPYMDGMDVESFCKSQVEPMAKECEQIQALALAEALNVQVSIEYLDGHELSNGRVTKHVFGPQPAAGAPALTFLYRPGHYDILYKGKGGGSAS